MEELTSEDVQKAGGAAGLLGGAALLVAVFWFAFAVYALHPALAFNAVRLPFEGTIRMKRWTPEGWKFFTRNPREDRAELFSRQSDGTWVDVGMGPNFTARNYFGLGRMPRAQGIELALLVHGVAKSEWSACTERPEACLERLGHVVPLTNSSPSPTLCGAVGFVMQETVPWAWSGNASIPVMPSRVMRLEVRC
jgi:antimicrobial peptide system SdpA family protein